MNENNAWLTALAWLGALGVVGGFVLGFAAAGDEPDALLLALGGLAQQLGAAALVGYVVARALIAQLLYRPREDLGKR